MASIPSYRLHKSSGQAIVTLSGRDYYLGAHGTPESRRKYNRLLDAYLASDKSPTFGVTPDQFVVNEILLGFLRYAKPHFKANQDTEYGHDLRIMFEEQVETARANLSLTIMKHFLVPLPPLAE